MVKDMQTERNHKILLQELQFKHEGAIENLEIKWENAADARVRLELQLLTSEKDAVIKSLQSTYAEDTSALKDRIELLDDQILDLKKEIVTLHSTVEEAEDRIYDEKQIVKEMMLSRAYSKWSAAVTGMQLKSSHRKSMEEQEKKFSDKSIKAAKESKERLSEATLLTLRLSLLLQKVEASRRHTQSVLTSHKTEVLVERRNQMRQFEKELMRMSNEKDQLLANRLKVEEDIANISQQVTELEDTIYAHNRSSAMRNGRINVAHVRKKRGLDEEMEKLLELVEIKRLELVECDERIQAKIQQRDEKELSLIDLERDLVKVLVEQQRMVLGILEEGRAIGEDCYEMVAAAGLPWPPPANPTLANALTFKKEEKEEEKMSYDY